MSIDHSHSIPYSNEWNKKLYYPGRYWGKVNYFFSDWCIQWHFWRFYTDPFDGLQEGCDLERVDVVLCITVCGGQWQWTESRYLDNGGPTSALCTQTLTRVQPGVTIYNTADAEWWPSCPVWESRHLVRSSADILTVFNAPLSLLCWKISIKYTCASLLDEGGIKNITTKSSLLYCWWLGIMLKYISGEMLSH